MSISDIRREYISKGIDAADLAANPMEQFQTWFDQAIESEVPDLNAMTLATVGEDGQPHARIVLLKEIRERGIVFYTNFNSAKGDEIEFNPKGSLMIFWGPLNRMVRLEGVFKKISHADSEKYFQSRPRFSQIAACCSDQSSPIESREALDACYDETEKELEGVDPIPCPEHWGGYELVVDYFEFWQGREARLHDRIVYKPLADVWVKERLCP